jgi:tripartite-type tricarboxylate transporter receptor subunit TctC
MSRALGQPVVIENVSGASGTVGSGKVARSKADGYTLLFFNLAFSTTPAFMASIPYDPQKDFEPVGLVNSAPFVVISRRDFDASTPQELFKALKEKGDSLNFAHGGVGGGAHLCAILLGQRLDVQPSIISYQGAGPALTDVISGQVDLFCAQATDVVPQLQLQSIKAFATTGEGRISQLPQLPTLE